MRRILIALLVAAPFAAQAQMPTVDPSGNGPPPPEGPPPNPYRPVLPPTILVTPPPEAPKSAEQEAKEAKEREDSAVYLGGAGTVKPGVRYEGETVPEVHVVQKGDTLWEICAYYFGNPWKWPEVWGLNPAITNPHWIYPGDLVRLMTGGAKPAEPTEPASAPASGPSGPQITTSAAPPHAISAKGVELRQVAFVSTEDLQASGKIRGANEERSMLSMGDEVYVDYPAGHPPQVGQAYSIYAPTRDIKHPKTGAKIGAYVLVHGEVTIKEVKKEKLALGEITAITERGIIERGNRVGTLKTRLRGVEPVAADRSLEGVIAGIIEPDQLIGEFQVVFIDRGKDDGLKLGNEMLVVRRGDASLSRHEISGAGHDDRTYPDHYIGSLMVVDVGKTTSMAFMTRSDEEVQIADHVLMRKP